MATLHVRNVPDTLYDEIRRRAAEHSRSLGAEIVVMLHRALVDERPAASEVLDELRRRRSFRPASVGAPDSTELLREDRSR